jgi:uncharacterized protein YbjT (DUF2867 family)
MRIVLFGATGMLGQGVLRVCLADDRVTEVLAVGRSPTGVTHPKLREILRADLFDVASFAGEAAGCDACFWCLGVSSLGVPEPEYRRVTHDLTLAVAHVLRPGMRFVYVSGMGADARSRTMWARVKGETENALLELPLDACVFRPGYVQPLYGATSRTRYYRLAYVVAAPFHPMLRRLFPRSVTTTEQIGRAMIAVAERGAPTRILDAAAINAL